MILREVADARLVPQASPCPRRRRGCPSTILSSVDLPSPFGPMIATRLAAPHGERHVAKHLLRAVGLATRRRPRARRARSGARARTGRCGARREVAASSSTSIFSICLSRLCACLRLGRLGAEAIDERALLGDDLLGARDLGLLALADRLLLDDERGVVAGVERDGARSRRRGCGWRRCRGSAGRAR